MASLADAPLLKTVPEDMTEIKKNIALLGSRLTGIETQVSTSANDLQKVQQTLEALPKQEDDQALPLDKVALENLKLQLEEKMYNDTTKMSFKVDEALDHFKIFGTNITEQLQKQEKRASKNWVSLELNQDSCIDNIFLWLSETSATDK